MEKKFYKTRDLAIASFLLATDELTLSGTEKEGKEVFFLFVPPLRAEELTKLYWSDKAPSVQPRKLFGAQRDLKDIIFGS